MDPAETKAATPVTAARPAAAYVVEVDHRLTVVIGTVGVLGIVVHLALIPFFAWLGVTWLALLNVASALAWIAGWQANRRGDHPRAVTLMTGEVVVHTVAAVSALGFQTGFQYYLIGAVPFTLFNTRWRTPQMLTVAGGMTIVFCALYLGAPFAAFDFPTPRIVRALHVTNAMITFVAIGLASYYFRVASVKAEQELEMRASTDVLTGLFNRRRMRELLEQEQARSARTGRPYALIVADLDRFKDVNDTHGHECGDLALRTVSKALDGRLRRTDALARWGGEEFVVLLPETGADGAARTAESLRRAIETRRIRFGEATLGVTATFGVAVGGDDEPVDAVLARADAALYRGKVDGRNRVVVDDVAPEPA